MSVDPYVSMVLAAPCEVFSRWKWQAGDRGILLGDGREVMIVSTSLQIKAQNLDTLTFLFPYSEDGALDKAGKADIVPLPSAKQLQEMSCYKWRSFDEICSLERNLLSSEIDDYITKEMAGFAAVMRMAYQRRWDGSSWIPVEEQ